MLRKVLIIVPGFPASEDDTTCLPAVHNYVRALARLYPEIHVDVISVHYPFTAGYYTWHNIPAFSAGGSNLGGLHKLRTWRRAWTRIREAAADLIHSFWVGECALLGAVAARGRASVVTIGGKELIHPTIYSRLLRRTDFLLVAGSRRAADTSLRTLQRSADAIIPLGLDAENFPGSAGRRSIDVLFVGSLIDTKRPGDLISVARHLQDARFVIVGDGPLRSELEEIAPSNVDFTGHIDRPQVSALMQQSKVLLHPSIFESQGYVFLEALASGMHVVCRDVGAPGDSANVHRRNTVDEMTGAVADLLRDIHSFPSVPVPTAQNSVEAYMEVYRRALAAKAAD